MFHWRIVKYDLDAEERERSSRSGSSKRTVVKVIVRRLAFKVGCFHFFHCSFCFCLLFLNFFFPLLFVCLLSVLLIFIVFAHLFVFNFVFLRENCCPCLIIVIFFTLTQFLENKIYTKKTRKLRQNTQ